MKPLLRLTVGLLLASTLLTMPEARAASPLAIDGAATPPLATLQIGASRLDWTTSGKESFRLALTVAGPDGFFYERRFEPGVAPSLDVEALGPARPQDGTYSYELRRVGKRGDRVQSGFFSLQAGSFFMPVTSGAEAPRRQHDLKLKDLDAGGELIATEGCFGSVCSLSDPGPHQPLRLHDAFLGIDFDDVLIGPGIFNNWAILINEGAKNFAIRDKTGSTTPMTITAGAPDNSLFVTSGGSIGLGTATPSVKIEAKVTSSGNSVARLQNLSSSGYSGIEYLNGAGIVSLYLGTDNANAFSRFNSVNSYPIVFMTQSNERMRITSGGNIGIGGAANPTSPIQHANGASLSAGGVWTNASSRALKQDIHELDAASALATLKGLTPVEFAYKLDPSEHHVGFIAEDVPDLVAAQDRKGLSPMDFVAVLAKVVQEQQKEIEALKEARREEEKARP